MDTMYRQGRGRIVELSWADDGDGEIDYAFIRGTETRPDGATVTRLVHAEIKDVTTAVAAAAAHLQGLEVDYTIRYTPNTNAPTGVPVGELVLGEQCDAVFTSLVPVIPIRGERPVWRPIKRPTHLQLVTPATI